MKYSDLHIHTRYSDGRLSPTDCVVGCALVNLDIISITDHDITDGYSEAKEESKKWGIELLSGVEITTRKYHILSYDFDIENKNLQKLLKYSRECQEDVVKQRIKILQEKGIPVSFERMKKHFPYSRLGKGNLIEELRRDEECRKYIGNLSYFEISQKYLKKSDFKNKIDKSRLMSAKTAIDAIHEAGGVAVIAHAPKDIKSLDELDELVKNGIDRIEIQPNFIENYGDVLSYAEKNKIPLTYGSDYHGPSWPSRPLLLRDKNIVEEFWRKK